MASEQERFIRHFRNLGHPDGDQQLADRYNSIQDKSLVDKVLAQYGDPPGQGLAQPNLSSYKYTAYASLYVSAFFGMEILLSVSSLSRSFKGNGGGVVFGFGGSGGTLYYNNVDDLTGDSHWNGNFVSLYSNVNFIRDGSVYATFSGGGSPLIGVSGGTHGKWNPDKPAS
jgi:hypothetical protein